MINFIVFNQIEYVINFLLNKSGIPVIWVWLRCQNLLRFLARYTNSSEHLSLGNGRSPNYRECSAWILREYLTYFIITDSYLANETEKWH